MGVLGITATPRLKRTAVPEPGATTPADPVGKFDMNVRRWALPCLSTFVQFRIKNEAPTFPFRRPWEYA